MSEMISYCGLNCKACPIYLATREKDEEKQNQMRTEIAQQIKELYGHEIKPEDVTDCDGCKTEGGRLFSGCHNCYMRKCAKQKNFENCAYCGDYACEELEKLFTTDPDARKRLDAIKNTI
ncbi:MAG: DUF3795 domain-containing protein [Planctomycetes bacterium]|nr:DUF3795 domain-containing protein [Planctomycetota bacterium]